MEQTGSFANKLRTTRKSAYLSQSAISKLMQIPMKTIQEWESGKTIPPEYIQFLVLEKIDQCKRTSPSFAAMLSFLCHDNNISLGMVAYFLKVPTKTVLGWITEDIVPAETEQETILETLSHYTMDDAEPHLVEVAAYVMREQFPKNTENT